MADDLNALAIRIRLYSGMLLYVYAITHLLNHSINIFSLETASYVKEHYFSPIWKSQLGTIVLYGSFLTHVPLGLISILSRKSFKISAKEWLQLIFIILALFVFVQHVASMYLLTRTFDSKLPYEVLFSFVLFDPSETVVSTVLYTLMLVFIWVHGSIGVHGALKFRAKGYSHNFGKIMAVYVGVPALGLFGFWAGLKEQTMAMYFNLNAGNDSFLMSIVSNSVPMEAFPSLELVEVLTLKYYPIFLLLIIVIPMANVLKTRYFGQIEIQYPNNVTVKVPKGTSILEASRSAQLPHKSVCGGRGRCTTCRVKIAHYEGTLPAPSIHEQRALNRAGLDQSVRLACQLKPASSITVTPLMNPENEFNVLENAKELSGIEQETVVLFVDLRNFTKLSETTLPYDVVYILNKYYATCGHAIEANTGRLDKFIGDGIMAIFDKDSEVKKNCSNALKAAADISESIRKLSDELSVDFSAELKCGMGIHMGQSIVGMMGYGDAISRTAIGDNVNVASRLEQMTKTYNSELVISKLVADNAGLDTSSYTVESVEIRGRGELLDIVSIDQATQLQFS